jgi:ketosteroid isomerase-like protein
MDPRLQDMLDHHEIRKTLAEYCHACDRADVEMMASVYTGDDSFDDHGHVKAPGPEYARVMTDLMLKRTDAASHILGQSLIEVDGDAAAAETFFFALFHIPSEDGPARLNQLAGRFVDRLERKDGKWKIRNRTCVRDTSISLTVERDDYASYGLAPGMRDASDPGAALLRLAHWNGAIEG